MIEPKLKANMQPWTAISTWLGLVSAALQQTDRKTSANTKAKHKKIQRISGLMLPRELWNILFKDSYNVQGREQ